MAADRIKYLASFGLEAINDATWSPKHPELTQGKNGLTLNIVLTGDEVIDGQTWYRLECSLPHAFPEESGGLMQWHSLRRFDQLKIMHDMVREKLGPHVYQRHFEAAPFASSFGWSTATDTLRLWCEALAHCLSSTQASPLLVAVALQFLGAPMSEDVPRAEAQWAPWSRGSLDDGTVPWYDEIAALKSEMLPGIFPPDDECEDIQVDSSTSAQTKTLPKKRNSRDQSGDFSEVPAQEEDEKNEQRKLEEDDERGNEQEEYQILHRSVD